MILFSFCDYPWWLAWLLPFLLGLIPWLLGRSRYSAMVEEYEGKIKGLHTRISDLEADLAACKSKRADLEGDLAMTKGRMRELENDLKDARKNAGKSKGGGAAAASFASGAATSSMAAETPATPKATSGGGSDNIYAALKDDNLQVIEGVGPKMESILKENGIGTLGALAAKETSDVQDILNKYGDKYKIIDPGTWVQQSKLAAAGKWEELIDLQKALDTGRDNAANLTDSKVEKLLIKMGVLKSFKQDDLKAIEGIGPAIAKLLSENGIDTWRGLANTSVDKVKSILDGAGSRFKLADPSTWPKQAELAADGKFKELQEYQDYLDGGKG